MDLGNLKNANARSLIYEQLDVHHGKRSKYMLKLEDYFLIDEDVERLASILERWHTIIKNMRYLVENKDVVNELLGSFETLKSQATNTESNTYQTEDNELVAQKFAQLESSLQVSETVSSQRRGTSELAASSRAATDAGATVEMSIDSNRIRKRKMVSSGED